MHMKALSFFVAASLTRLGSAQPAKQQNSTIYNPILPGFNPDPSCVFVKEWDNTFFCATSTFLAFPGIPIHASKDLQNFRLIGHAFSRPEQLPAFGNITGQQQGWYAPTLRYHNKRFWIINSCVGAATGYWSTSDPYNNDAWTNVTPTEIPGYDPDLFWDTDGTVYSAFAKTVQNDPFTTEIHQVNISMPSGNTTTDRFLSAQGPFEANPANPILTAYNTSQYFQTVGHADLFQDAAGNWWGVALATRSGPEYETWPMGRETVLYPAKWEKGQWPVLGGPVKGKMSGPLPPANRNIRGTGAFIKDPDYYKFSPGSSIPSHFSYWRFPKTENYAISPKGHPNTLRLLPSRSNLTGDATALPTDGITFIGRRQTDTLFTYSVDVDFSPSSVGDESGVTLFLTQDYHADLGIVRLNKTGTYLRFHAEGPGAPTDTVLPIPQKWNKQVLTLQIQAYNTTHFSFSAGPKAGRMQQIATVPATLVSNGFTGSFVGVHATNNGNTKSNTPSYISNWVYQGQGQYIGNGEFYPSNGKKGGAGF
ncbi:xylosidase : arabinofuranosidase [Aureobasidium pullulans]|uniref:Xylosidase: arabinofuranosidase n=1 Tax=Aureobasidium pullulans TaxID=5580 RepID=A0A4S8S6G1_AURPU|nr:xylosidase : arabinofuranosidase [Aureobasidium pullulans]